MTTTMVDAPEPTPLPIIDDAPSMGKCDRCGSRAFASACTPHAITPLLFCGHHIDMYLDTLTSRGFIVQDDRRLLYELEAKQA